MDVNRTIIERWKMAQDLPKEYMHLLKPYLREKDGIIQRSKSSSRYLRIAQQPSESSDNSASVIGRPTKVKIKIIPCGNIWFCLS